ncbi:MAG: TIGR03545 family protein [Pseudobdellovibrio sp.]
MSDETKTKAKKPQGPIRWNAIIPFLIVSALFYLYFVLFFDANMKSAIEWVGYKAMGTEVNVGQFKSSFLKGSVQISKIEVTSAEKPEFNSIELGDIRFDLNWDALLRVKFVIEEIAVEGVQFMSKRAHPGKVAPPEPPSNEPSFTDKLQAKAVDKLGKENQNNVLGDTAQFLKTGKFDDQIKNIQDQLQSKKLVDELSAKWKAKQTDWNAKLKTLPTSADLNAIKDRFGKIKYQNFSSVQELNDSVKQAQDVMKDLDTKNKQIQDLKSQFDDDMKSFDADYKSIDAQVKKDVDSVKSRFQIPKIDAASFAKELFMGYLTPYTQKLDHYKALAEKYLPPKYAKMVKGEKTKAEPDDSIQALPREKGLTYEFPVKNGYPLFWIQKIKVSSKSNGQTDYGDINGLISDITSNQRQIGKPTTAHFEGQFNKMNVKDIKLNAKLDNTGDDSIVSFDFGIGSYPLSDLKLIDSKDGSISIPKTNANLISSGQVVGFQKYDLKLNNTFNDVNFNVSSGDQTIAEVLKTTFGSVNKFDLQATATGELKDLNIDIRSSLGGDLEKAFNNLLQNKIKEANDKVQKAVNDQVDKIKEQLNTQVNGFKAQAQGEVNKVQAQFDDQKKQAQAKIDGAKKDAEDKAKKSVGDELQKKADELKKKFHF